MATLVICILVYCTRGVLSGWAEKLFAATIILLAISIDADVVLDVIKHSRDGD